MKIRTAKARNSLVAILFIAMIFVFAGNPKVAYADSTNVNYHSKADVVNHLKNNNATVNDAVEFSVTPVKGSVKGALNTKTKNSALMMLNNVRYVAGLDPVSLNDTFGGKAQAAAFVNWSIGQLTHYPSDVSSKPDGMSTTDWNDGDEGAGKSNIAYGRDTLNETIVFGWMGDSSSASNVKNVGHRRWCLNPDMSSTGFGATRGSSFLDKYYAMWSMDEEAAGTQTNVAWPARYMPVEFFDGNIPWSLSTGNTSITNISNVSVQLTRRSSSTSGSGSWSFSTSKTYTAATTGEYFGVQINNPYQGYMGQPGPFVVFRPADITYKAGDIFDVTITGLGSSTISYTVEFISGYPVETMSFDEEEYQMTAGFKTIKPTITPSSAKGYEISYSSSDESVVTVDSYGELTKVGDGEATITATIDGRYTASGNPLTASYRVKAPRSINGHGVEISFDERVDYSGKKADINIVITDGDKTLVEGTDYTVSIPDDAIKPKMTGNTYYSYVATIKGIGNYYGESYKYFWIYKKSLYDCRIVLTPESAEYTGGNQKPSVAVYNGDVLMTEGTDYTIAQNDGGTNKGSYNVRVSAASGSDCYSYSGWATFKITEKTITEDMIADIDPLTYTGSAQTPNVTVISGSVTLKKDTDYTVTYSNNTNIGKATATISGKGNYKGTVSKEFTISAKPLTDNMVTLNKTSAEFNGEIQKPTVTVKDGSRTLNEGTDYTLTNSGGINAGTYGVSVEGKGNYSGNVSKSFTINAKALTDSMVTLGYTSTEYNGQNQNPYVTVEDGNRTLIEDTDYTLLYSGGTDAGTYQIEIQANDGGNYSGSVVKEFTIIQRPLSDSMIRGVEDRTYDGSYMTPGISVSDGGRSVQYEITDRGGGMDAGEYTVKIRGYGNYTGEASKTYSIIPKSIEDISFPVGIKTYSGEQLQPAFLESDIRDPNITKNDYYVEYNNNDGINVGTYTVTIKGKNNYCGSRTGTVRIVEKNISDTDVVIEPIPEQLYTGVDVEPIPVIEYNGKTLTNDDFTLSYADNTAEGTGKVTVTGKGNFKGAKALEFSIVSKERLDLIDFIATLEQDLNNEEDEDFKSAIIVALQEAREALKDDATPNELSIALAAAKNARTAAVSALEEKKEAARVAAEEAAKAAEKAKRAKQSGQGGAVGKGASMEFAEKSILASTSDEGPKGSKYAPLQLRSTKQANTSVTLAWNKVKGAKKYIIYGNACGKKNKMKKIATSTGKLNYVVKKLANKKALKKGTYHKFMIVALDSKNNVISTSKVVHVATKGNKKMANPTKITLKAPKTLRKGKTHKLAAKQVGKYVQKHRGLAYETSNAKVATVSKGVIKATGKGTCYVYVYVQNGLFKKVKVTVK